MVWARYTLRRTSKRVSCKEQSRGKEAGADRRRVGPTTSLNGQGKASLSLRHQVEPAGLEFIHHAAPLRPWRVTGPVTVFVFA